MKPGFFKNEDLAECGMTARVLFAGLWCFADREGRLEDRPKRLKAEIFPYDNCDIDKELIKLAAAGFLLRYAVNGENYLQVLNFTKHQNPHVKENASTIPAPDLYGTRTGNSGTGPADSLLPITDSLNPLTVSPESGSRPMAGSKSKSIGTPLPDWIDISSWLEWELHRKEIKKKLTASAVKKQIAFLEKHKDNHVQIIEQSIRNGWTGLFEYSGSSGVTRKKTFADYENNLFKRKK